METDFKPKNIKGELYPFQKIAVEFLIKSNGRAMLALDMGLGKSLISLAYVSHEGFKKTLVVCPASVKHSWASEILKWTDMKFRIINSTSKPEEILDPNIQILVCNYDILKKHFQILNTLNFNVCILDEAHFLKSKSTVRSRVVKLLSLRIPRIIEMSGTPFLNRPEELFVPLNILDPQKWNDWMWYVKRYCNARQRRFGRKVIWDTSGASNIPELREKISSYFLRYMKKDVLAELPEKINISMPVELSEDFRIQYDAVLEDFPRYLAGKGRTELEIAKAMSAEKLVKLNELRQITTRGKMEAIKELISNILQTSEDKIIVFSVYNEPLAELQKDFPNSVSLTGKTNEVDRADAVTRFQTDPVTRVFFGGLKAAGVGVTLTEGSHVIFCDFSWVGADHAQGQDRAMRIGQKKSVNVYSLYAKDSIDEFMVSLLNVKEGLFNFLINNKDNALSEDSFLNTLYKMVEKKI